MSVISSTCLLFTEPLFQNMLPLSFVWWMYECIPHGSRFGLFPGSSITQYKYDLKNKLDKFQPGSHLGQLHLSSAHCQGKGDPPSHIDKQEVGTYIYSLLYPLIHDTLQYWVDFCMKFYSC